MLSILATILFLIFGQPAPTTDQIGWPPIICGNPCVIEEDHGGVVDLYAAQGRLAAAGHVPVIVDGPCLSACTIFVDIDRANVCVTTKALLGYHKSMHGSEDAPIFGDIQYKTPGLEAYIKAQGGLPNPDSGHMLMLNSEEAKQFYKACPTS
jgi:hypothetical protein